MSEAMIIPAPVDEEVLHRLGANFTAEIRDGAGDLTGYEVRPEIDLSGYGAMLETIRRERLLAHARDLRWRIEIGGILVGGVPIATDDRSKTMILGSRIAAMVDPEWTAPWDGADGGSYPVDATTIMAISDAVQAHVNAVFAVFDAVKTAIEAGTITTREQVEAAAWPPNL